MLRLFLVILGLFMIFVASHVIGQDSRDVEIMIESYETKEFHIEICNTMDYGFQQIPRSDLEMFDPGSFHRMKVYYRYDAKGLVTHPARHSSEKVECILLLVTSTQPSAIPTDMVTIWQEKFVFHPWGTCIDQQVKLKVSVTDNLTNRTEDGTITVDVHNHDPSVNLEVIVDPRTDHLKVNTGERKEYDVTIRNKSCFDVQLNLRETEELFTATLRPLDPGLWEDQCVALATTKILRARQSPQSQFESIRLRLQPNSKSAFWKTFLPGSECDTVLSWRIPFSIGKSTRDGKNFLAYQSGELQQRINIVFSPSIWWILFFLLFGATLSALLTFLMATVTRNGQQANSPQTGLRDKIIDGLKRLAVRWIVAIVAFLLYFLTYETDKKTVVFGFEMDPTQLLPALIFGFIVGSQPVYFFKQLKTLFQHVTKTMICAFILIPLLSVASLAASSAGFRPSSMIYDEQADTHYLLSSANNVVYLIDSKKQIRPLAKLDYLGNATDLCLLTGKRNSWLVVAANRNLNGVRFQVNLALIPISTPTGTTRILKSFLGSARVQRIAFDREKQRLLIIDRGIGGVYELRLSGIDSPNPSASKPTLIFSFREISSPVSILPVRGGTLYIGDNVAQTVFEADLAKKTIRKLGPAISMPSSLALNRQRTHLWILDQDSATVFEYRLGDPTGRCRKILENSVLKDPCTIQPDRDDSVWIADCWKESVFQFDRQSRLLQYIAPR